MDRNLIVSRVALAALFIVSGLQKIIMPGMFAHLFAGFGLPAETAILVGLFELGSGVVFITGYKVQWVAAAMGVWCILTALMAHHFWSDPTQIPNFLKNVGLAGAFLLFATRSPIATPAA